MADIERWITVNGAHIPIIKGESRTKAVANFIKSKRAGKGRNVKGYSTDPYNRVKKANKEANDTYDYLNEYVQRAEKEYSELRQKNYEKGKALYDKLDKKYPNHLKDELRYRKFQGEKDVAEERMRHAEREADNYIRQRTSARDLGAKEAYLEELNRDYGGYKLNGIKYKANTPTKKTITGYGKTDRMKKADKDYDRQYNKAEQRVREALHMPSTVREKDEAWGKYQRASKTAKTKKTKAYTYKMSDANRRKMINDLGNKVTKLDRQVENAKTNSAFRRLQKKQERTQKAINTFGGKYIVGRKKKK